MEPKIDGASELAAKPPASSLIEDSGRVRAPHTPCVARPAAEFAHPFAKASVIGLFGAASDLRDWAISAGLGIAYLVAGIACLSLSRFDAMLAGIWLPNAIAIAVLFLARLRNELPAFLAIAAASAAANALCGNTLTMVAAFTAANVLGIFLVTWLTRRACGEVPDMSDLSHLGYFLQYGGVLGPCVGALIAAPAIGSDLRSIWTGASVWFLVESLGTILLVPACLLLAQISSRSWRSLHRELIEAAVLSALGLCAVYLVFNQNAYPLLFLIPPITLLVAFRLGTLGTALFVPGIAIVACLASFAGLGPIAESGTDKIAQVHLIQSFIAANFLTGLPIAAILAGRKRLAQELEKGRRELALLTEGITDAVLMIDAKGVVTYASPSVAEVLGPAPESYLGQHVETRAHEDAAERIMGFWRSF